MQIKMPRRIQGPLTLVLRGRRRAVAFCRLCSVFWTMSFHWSSEISRAQGGTPRDGSATAAIVLFTSSTWSGGQEMMLMWQEMFQLNLRSCEQRTCIHRNGGSTPYRCSSLRVVLLIAVWRRRFGEVEPHHLQEVRLVRQTVERKVTLCRAGLTSILCCTCCSCSAWEGASPRCSSSSSSSSGCSVPFSPSGSWFRGW